MILNPKHFKWHEEGNVGVVTLNRPERKNPLTFDSYAELRDGFNMLAKADSIRSIIITGAGENFCSGGDVHEIIGPLTKMNDQDLLKFTQMTGDLIKAIMHCPKVVISAIDGVCAGAGAAVAMASDLRYGTSRSKVAFLFIKVGLGGCDMGACAILPRIIGHGRASELLYSGRAMSGDEALTTGFYSAHFLPEELQGKVMGIAKSIANGPTQAHALTKRMLQAEWNMEIDSAIDAEAKAQAGCMKGKDFLRAYEAFVEKRTPEFKGD